MGHSIRTCSYCVMTLVCCYEICESWRWSLKGLQCTTIKVTSPCAYQTLSLYTAPTSNSTVSSQRFHKKRPSRVVHNHNPYQLLPSVQQLELITIRIFQDEISYWRWNSSDELQLCIWNPFWTQKPKIHCQIWASHLFETLDIIMCLISHSTVLHCK